MGEGNLNVCHRDDSQYTEEDESWKHARGFLNQSMIPPY